MRSSDRPTASASSSIGGLALEVLHHLALHADDLVDRLHHVHRDADGAGLVGDGPGDGLADPPRGVGGELEALRVVELLDRPHQAEVALLDQVEEVHAAADVALGDRHDEAEVGLDEHLAGVLAAADGALQGPALVELEGGELAGGGQVGQPDGGEATGLDAAGVLDLLGAGEERHPADLLEVHAHRVGRAAAAVG